MFPFFIFSAIARLNGNNYNNRTFEDSKTYKNLQSIRADRQYIRHGHTRAQHQAEMVRNRKQVALIMFIVIMSLIAIFVVLPHLPG